MLASDVVKLFSEVYFWKSERLGSLDSIKSSSV